MTRTTDLLEARQRKAGVALPVESGGRSSLPFGANAQAVRYRKLDLSTARDRERIPVSAGNVIAVMGSSAPLAYALASFSETNQDRVPLREGLIFRGVPYRDLYLSHVAQPDQYLGLLTLVDPAARFDIQLPPPISPGMAHLSGFGFEAHAFLGAVAEQFGHLALLNRTTDWVGIVDHVVTSDADPRPTISTATNATLFSGLSAMSTSSIISTFSNYHGADAANERAPQLDIMAGARAVSSVHAAGYRTRDNILRGGQVTHPEGWVILPGYHLLLVNPNSNEGYFHGARWFEIPKDLWGG